MNWLISVGGAVRDAILGAADLLASPAAPGIVSLVLAGLLAVVVVLFLIWQWRRNRVLRRLRNAIRAVPRDRSFVDLDTSVSASLKGGGEAATAVREAWDGFKQTLVATGDGPARNTIRPGIYFGLEELGFTPGFYRHWPGLFVSLGLFLTFLGLISALGQAAEGVSAAAEGDIAESDRAITDLLSVASAKFVMSLTGLACSIVFSILLRFRMSAMERSSHDLSAELERRLDWVSFEETALNQLRALNELRDHMTAQTTSLVAELGQALDSRIASLGEAIAAPVGDAMTRALQPVLERVASQGQDRVGTMVGDLSQRLSADIGEALGQASAKLSEAAERLDGLARGFGDSFAEASRSLSEAAGTLARTTDSAAAETQRAMTEGLQATIDGLRTALAEFSAAADEAAGSTTQAMQSGMERLLGGLDKVLEDIRDNTARGAAEMGKAADAMREAASAFSAELGKAATDAATTMRHESERAALSGAEQITTQGRMLGDALGRAAEDAAREAQKVSEALSGVSSEVMAASEGTRALAREIGESAGSAERSAAAFERAGTAAERAGESLTAGSDRLAAAAEPVRAAADGARETADVVTRSATELTRRVEQVIGASAVALKGERESIEATLAALTQTLARLKGQGDRLDQIDEKLGAAFESYLTQVNTTLGSLSQHVQNVSTEHAQALATLREVVSTLDTFRPGR